MMTAMKLAEFRAKVQGMPTTAIRTPPMPGPITRAMLNIVLLSATALTTADRSFTCSPTNDCLVGQSTALISPVRAAMTSTCQNCAWPPNATTARAAAASAYMVCVNSRIERLGKRSMIGPMNTERTREGRNWMLVSSPSLNGESVSLRTSQAWPVF